jgi:hypothetical protein
MGDGRWEMGDGRWEIGDGRWEMGDGGGGGGAAGRGGAKGLHLVLSRGLVANAVLIALVVIREFTHDPQAANL